MKDSAQKLNIAFLKNDGWKLDDFLLFFGGGGNFQGQDVKFLDVL